MRIRPYLVALSLFVPATSLAWYGTEILGDLAAKGATVEIPKIEVEPIEAWAPPPPKPVVRRVKRRPALIPQKPVFTPSPVRDGQYPSTRILDAMPIRAGKPVGVVEARKLMNTRLGAAFRRCLDQRLANGRDRPEAHARKMMMVESIDRIYVGSGVAFEGRINEDVKKELFGRAKPRAFGQNSRIYQYGRKRTRGAMVGDDLAIVDIRRTRELEAMTSQIENASLIATPAIPPAQRRGHIYGKVPSKVAEKMFAQLPFGLGDFLKRKLGDTYVSVDASDDVVTTVRIESQVSGVLTQLASMLRTSLGIIPTSKLPGPLGQLPDMVRTARVRHVAGAVEIEFTTTADELVATLPECRPPRKKRR